MTTVDMPPAVGQPEEVSRTTADAAAASHRRAMRTFRPRRVVPATIVAALLALLALLAAAEVISRLFDRPLDVLPVNWLSRLGRDNTWQDPLTVAVAVVLILLGLLLLALAWWPGRARVVPVQSGHADAAAVITHRAMARYVAAAAERVDGVDRARVSVRRGRVRVRVNTPLHDPDGLPRQVREAVGDQLRRLAPLRPLRLQVSVRPERGSR